MTDAGEPIRGRGPRTATIVVAVLLAFLAGVVLMGLVARRLPWLGTTATRATAVKAEPSGFTPSAPLGADGQPDTPDAAQLTTREAALAAQLAALEARTAAVSADATAAGGQASRAEALLVVLAARRQLDRGQGLGYLEEQLRARFGSTQPRAVAAVLQAARQPVTLEDLRQGLDAIAPDISVGGDGDWWDGLHQELTTLVVLRKGGTPSPLPADRLARAHRLLDGGQVEAARAEIARLPGADEAANWLAAADRYTNARRALDIIENGAILGQGTTPVAGSAPA